MPILQRPFDIEVKNIGKLKFTGFTSNDCQKYATSMQDSNIPDRKFAILILSDHLFEEGNKEKISNLTELELKELVQKYIKQAFDIKVDNIKGDILSIFRIKIKESCSSKMMPPMYSEQLKSALALPYKSLFSDLTMGTASLASLSTLATQINNLQSAYETALKPSIEIIKKIQGYAIMPGWLNVIGTVKASPLLRMVSEVQDVDTRIINRPSTKDVIKKIEPVNSDKAFNFIAYKYIFTLEVILRKFIQKIIIEPNKDILSSKISPEMLEEWKCRKEKEETNLHIDNTGYELIEYSDFSDIRQILNKKSTKNLLRGILNEENITTVSSKLIELEPIRKKIAHSRLISRNELDTLKFYSKKILIFLRKIGR